MFAAAECYGFGMKNLLVCTIFAAAIAHAGGCYTDDGAPQYAEDDGGGDLVEVSPGVEVVADYDEPVFFADDYYWVNRGGIWYSSGWYGGGWVRAGRVPEHIRGIEHPEVYRHYRPAGYVAHERVRGGYTTHAQYHAAHPSGSVHVRAAVHSGGHRR